MVYVFLDLFASLYRSTIGLAVKPAVVLSDSVHTHVGLAEPAHEAIAAIFLGQTSRLGCSLPKRHRSIARGKALGRSSQHSAHRKGIRITSRLVFAQHGCQNGCRTRAGKIDRRLNALAMHGDHQLVVHRPFVCMPVPIGSRAHGAGTEVVIMLLPQLTCDVAFVVPGTESGTGYRTVTRKGVNLFLSRGTLAASV